MPIKIDDFKIYEIKPGDYTPTSEIKWITGLKHKIEISDDDFMEHAQLRDWCLENCNNKVVFVQNVDYRYSNTIELYFYNEEDAAACKLRWV